MSKKSHKHLSDDCFIENVRNISWDNVLTKDDPNNAAEALNKLYVETVDKRAPVKKRTIRNLKFLWIDEKLKDCMVQRNQAKKIANNSADKINLIGSSCFSTQMINSHSLKFLHIKYTL